MTRMPGARRIGRGALVGTCAAMLGATTLALAACSSPMPAPAASAGPSPSRSPSTTPSPALSGAPHAGTSTAIAACQPTQLSLASQDGPTAMGFSYGVFVFTNTGTTACSMTGYPTVTETGPAAVSTPSGHAPTAWGAPVAPEYSLNGWKNPTAEVVLRPGTVASFFMDMEPAILNGSCWGALGARSRDVLDVVPPGAGAALALPGQGEFCGDQVPPVSPVFRGIVFQTVRPTVPTLAP